jgi:aryl-alcohol dehydrogenase-like predicted oxidoreductase
MDYTLLGRTKLKVSEMGLGCGGQSRLGQSYGKSKEDSIQIVKLALDQGINFIDTAEAYRTEEIVGRAIKGHERESLVISTKKSTFSSITEKDVRKSLEASLRRLDTEYVDIYHLHGVDLSDYGYLVKKIVPVLLSLKQEGKIQFLGITERFNYDTNHRMLQRALQDEYWDVIMVGFNILNQSARYLVFPRTIEKNIGVLVMFAVRSALSKPDRLRQCLKNLIDKKQIDQKDVDIDNPLSFLINKDGGTVSITDAAYRFCRYELGTHVILSGTGNLDHLKQNIESFKRPPLPEKDLIRLRETFRKVDSISGQ